MAKKSILMAAVAATTMMLAGSALAGPSNVGEPAGTVILDLNGTAISSSWTTVSQTFVAGAAATDIAFAFRDDPWYIRFDNASVTAGGPNLLVNGDFGTGDLTGWTYQNPQGAAFNGYVTTSAPDGNPSPSWYDGSVQAYDTLDQVIATVIGQTYTVSFDYFENSGQPLFSRLSTNGDVTNTGGNGLNIVVYAGNAQPVLQGGVPEPASWAMMLLGFGGLGAMLRRDRARTAAFA